MGHEISYCVRCAVRIGGADFEKGKAFRVAGAGICANCITPEEQSSISRSTVVRGKSTTRIKAPKPGPGTSARIPAPGPDPRVEASKAPVFLGISAAVIAAVGIGGWMLSGSRPPPDPEVAVRPAAPSAGPAPRPAAEVEAPPQEKPEDPQLREAREAVEAARARRKSSPNDFEAQRAAWEEAARKTALTPYFKEASAELQAVRELLGTPRPPEPAKPAERPPEPSPAEPVRPEPAPSKPAESAVAAALWTQAMTKASGGDFEGAIADLRKDPAGNAEADELVRAQAALVQSREELRTLPPGQPIALTARAGEGERRRVEGVLVRAGAARLEIKKGEETVWVEIPDITAASLVELCRPSTSLHHRYALLCLLEGDSEPAERLAGKDGFTPRYWDYAKTAASKVPRLSSRELEARRLFYGAERDYAKPETVADAAGKYKTLLDAYADTAVVRGDQARIKARAEAGKDYVLSAYALKGTGTFALASSSRSDVAWTSRMDIDSNQALTNFVEGEFTAFAGQSYKAWALIGACCTETFTFYLQTTEGTELNTKSKQRESIEPGAAAASIVKHNLKELARSHRSHVTKVEKAPTRWEWIGIPLPKYAAPGPKKIRLLSDQQGFSVGAIVISSTRSAPPTDAQLKEEAARAKAALTGGGLSVENPGERAWKPLLEGKSVESFLRGPVRGWKVEDGHLVNVPGVDDAAQTQETFADGEIRVRFECQDLSKIWFNLRQGGAAGAGYQVNFDGDLKPLEGRSHDLVFRAKGDQVTATLDGKPVSVFMNGAAASGCLQFNANGKRFALLSLDFRPITP